VTYQALKINWEKSYQLFDALFLVAFIVFFASNEKPHPAVTLSEIYQTLVRNAKLASKLA
jgi:hypothetical protein